MKKKAALISLIAMTSFSLVVTFLGAFAWFVNSVSLGNMNISGESDETYFAYGKGTQAEPFGINTPRHLYNLSWLQFAGLFNKDANNDGKVDKQYYFEIDPNLSGELNMSGWTIPPIGTETYPFVGTFNGNNKVISNLTVSNQSSFDKKPESITYNSSNQPEVVGFFGVVGDLPEEETATSVVSIHNFTLKNTTVKSTTEHVLIGLAAGYVNSDMSGVKVDGTATIDVNGRTTAAKTDYSTKLSDYGLVGYTTKTGSTGTYQQKLSEVFQQGKSGGEDTNWGGSVNMLELNKRIYYFLNQSLERKTLTNIEYNAAKLTTSRYHRYFADDVNSKKTFAISVYEAGQGVSYDPWYNADPTNPPSNRYPLVYRFEGKRTDAKDGASGTGTVQLPGTYIPLLADTAENGYTVLTKNTGYIASEGFYGSGTSVRTASYKNIMIGNSVSPYSTTEGTTFDPNKIEVLSNSAVNYAAGNYARINNGITSEGATIQTSYSASIDPTTFHGYSDAYSTLKDILTESKYVQGLHFTGNEINKNNTVTVPNAYINGTEKTNYPVLTSSVDFNLKENGSIKFFAGTYYNSVGTNADSFFSLHVVKRSGNSISNTYQIYDIYENTNTSTKKAYPNLYYDSSGNLIEVGYTSANVTRGSKLFDLRFLHNAPPMANAIYYFEIPVNTGEFALGSVSSSKTKGAYLMYLDIGTNGKAEDKIEAYSITTIANSNTFPLGVDFIPITTSGNGGDTIAVSVIPGQGTVVFTVTSNNISVTNSASLASYAYRNATNYVASGPGSGQFTCNLTGDPPNIAAGGTRVLMVELETLAGAKYSVRVIDTLDSGGSPTNSVYEVDDLSDQAGYVTSTESAVAALSTDENYSLSAFRALTIAVVLTRETGTSDFTTTYNLDDCSYANKVVDVNIALNGTTISSVVTTGYTFTPHYV